MIWLWLAAWVIYTAKDNDFLISNHNHAQVWPFLSFTALSFIFPCLHSHSYVGTWTHSLPFPFLLTWSETLSHSAPWLYKFLFSKINHFLSGSLKNDMLLLPAFTFNFFSSTHYIKYIQYTLLYGPCELLECLGIW